MTKKSVTRSLQDEVLLRSRPASSSKATSSLVGCGGDGCGCGCGCVGGYGVCWDVSMCTCEWMGVLFGVESEYTACTVCAYIMYVVHLLCHCCSLQECCA